MATNSSGNEGLQGSPTSRSSLAHARNARTVIDLAIHTQMEQLRRGTSSSPLVRRRHKRFGHEDEDEEECDDDGLDGRGDSFLLVNVEDDDDEVDDDERSSSSEREGVESGNLRTPLRQVIRPPGGIQQQQQQSWRQQQQQQQQPQPPRRVPVPRKLNRRWPPPQAQPRLQSQSQSQSQQQQRRQLQRGDSGGGSGTGADSDLEVVLVDDDDDDDDDSGDEEREREEEPTRMGARPRATPAPPLTRATRGVGRDAGAPPPPPPARDENRGGEYDREERGSTKPVTVMASSPREDEYVSAATSVAKAAVDPANDRRVSFNPMQMKREKNQEPRHQHNLQQKQLPRTNIPPAAQRRQELRPRGRVPLDEDALDAPNDEIDMIQSSLGLGDPNDMPADEYEAHVRTARLPRSSVDPHPHDNRHNRHRAPPQSRPEPETEPKANAPERKAPAARQVGGRYVHVDPVLASDNDAPAWSRREDGAGMSNAALADEEEEEGEQEEVDERGGIDLAKDGDEAGVGLGIAPRGGAGGIEPQREEITQGDFSVSVSVGAAAADATTVNNPQLYHQSPGDTPGNDVVTVHTPSSSEKPRTDVFVADASVPTNAATKMTSPTAGMTGGDIYPDKAPQVEENEAATFATMNTTLTTLETTQSSFNTTNQDISLNSLHADHDVSNASSTYYQQQSSAPCTTVAGVVTPACYNNTSFESQQVPPTSDMNDFHFFEGGGGGGGGATMAEESEESSPPPPPPPADMLSTPTSTSIDYTTPQMRNTKTPTSTTDRTPPSAASAAASPTSSENIFSTLLEGIGAVSSSPSSSSPKKAATGGEENGDGGPKEGGMIGVGEAATGVTDALASAIAWLDSPLVDTGGEGEGGRKKNKGTQKDEENKPINTTIAFSPKKKKRKDKSSSPSSSNSPPSNATSAAPAMTAATNVFHPRLSVSPAEETNTTNGATSASPQTPLQRSIPSSDNNGEQERKALSSKSSTAGRKNHRGSDGGGKGRSSTSVNSSTAVGGGGGGNAIEQLADKENAEEAAGCSSFLPSGSGTLWDTVAYYMDPFNMLGINEDEPKPRRKGRSRDAGRRRSKRRGGGGRGRGRHNHDGYSDCSSSDDGSSCGSRSLEDDRSWISDDDDRSYVTDVTERTPVNETTTPVMVTEPPTRGLTEEATAANDNETPHGVTAEALDGSRDVESSHASGGGVGVVTPDVHQQGGNNRPVGQTIHNDNVLAHAVPFLDDGAGASSGAAANNADRGPSPGESSGSETRDNANPHEKEPPGTATISTVEMERATGNNNEKAPNPHDDDVEAAEVNDEEDDEHATGTGADIHGLTKEEEFEYAQQVKLQLQHDQEHVKQHHIQQSPQETELQPAQHHQPQQQMQMQQQPQHSKPSGQKPLRGILRLNNRSQRIESERADEETSELRTNGQPPSPTQVGQQRKKPLVGILRSHQPERDVNKAAHGSKNEETADGDPRHDEGKAQVVGASPPAQEPKIARPSQAELDEQFINDFVSEGISLTWHSAHSTENYVPPPTVHLGMEMVNDGGPSSMEPVFSWHVKGRPKKAVVHPPSSSSGGIHNGHLRVFDVTSLGRVGNMNLHSYPFVVPNNSFCMTDGDGSVVLFEARSEREQKRIVRGLRVLVSRLVSDIISGNDDAFFLRLDQEQLLPRSKAMDELAHLLVDESRAFAQSRKPMAV